MKKYTYKYENGRILPTISYVLSYFIMILLYGLYVTKNWEYMGFTANFNWIKFTLSTFVISFFSIITPTGLNTRSFFLNIIIISNLIPSMTLYAYADQPTYAAIVICMAISIVYVISAVQLNTLSLIGINAEILMWISVLVTGCLILAFYFIGGFRHFNLDIWKVYDYRRAAAAELPGAFSYLSPIFSSILTPFGILISIIYRKYVVFAFFLGASIMQFGFTSHKSILFSPFVALGIYFILLRFRRFLPIQIILLLSLSVGMIATLMMAGPDDSSIWGNYNTLFIRRTLMVPSLLDYTYFDFFSKNEYYYWASSKLTFGLVDSPYTISSAKLIGDVYYNNADMSANTGFIGSGFAQAGILGVIFYSFGTGLILAILQAYGRRLGHTFVIAIAFQSALNMFSSTDFLTLFMTHGMMILIILLMIMRPPNVQSNLSLRTMACPGTAPHRGGNMI